MDGITVVGSLNMDLVVCTPQLPHPGETVVGTSFNLVPGGKGANQAVAASQAGAFTNMVGCVGSDPFGLVLIKSLKESGVNTHNVQIMQNISTGTASIIVENNGENRIVAVPGTNGMVSINHIKSLWQDISRSSMILMQNEIPLPTIYYIINKAYREGIKVVYNPSPVFPIPAEVLKRIDILIVNKSECSNLIGFPVTDRESAFEATFKWYQEGVKNIIVTFGNEGAIFFDGNNKIYQPAFKVNVVDTTAAGDTFVGVFAAAILSGKTPNDALISASAAAGLAVTKLGAQPSIPNAAEISEFLSKNPKPIKG